MAPDTAACSCGHPLAEHYANDCGWCICKVTGTATEDADQATTTAATDDAALEDMITTLRENYRDAFGRYPSERQMEDFLEEHPGALDLWRQVSRHA